MLNKKGFFIVSGLLGSALISYYFLRPVTPQLRLTPTSFAKLPAWQQDQHSQALAALQNSCIEILKRRPEADFSGLKESGKVAAWQKICNAANKLTSHDDKTAREFFETWFSPYQISNRGNPQGLFTGYYLPELHANLKRNKQFTVPIYGLPKDLIKINLGLFRPNLAGTTLIAQQDKNILRPYPDRAAINRGVINKTTDVIMWSDNAIDLFFAQIQGSALVTLPNKKKYVLHYISSNGQPYTPIGKVLIAKNALTRKNISMQTIRAWLEQHPEEVDMVLNQNASYVFFKATAGENVIGMEEVPLSAQRSLAVDTHLLPLGAPIWLDTKAPQLGSSKLHSFQHLLIAQDTGGVIRGIVRGDVYWGAGDAAAFSAGHMQSLGRYWVLMPKSI